MDEASNELGGTSMECPSDPELAATVSRAGLHPFTGRLLASVGELVTLPAGWTVLFEDTRSGQALLVLSGNAEIRHDGSTMATLTAGAFVGESLIAARHPVRGTLVALSAVQVLRLAARDVARIVDADPDFAARLESIVVSSLPGSAAGGSSHADGVDAGRSSA